jgi:hypothetical protein
MIAGRKRVTRAQAITLVPTYLVYLVVRRVCRKHPWYHTSCTYNDWCLGATDTCRQFGVLMSLSIWLIPVLTQVILQNVF